MISRKYSFVSLICIWLLTVFLYWPIFKYGFSQDDFIHLSVSRASTIGQFLNFFNPAAQFESVYFYRPLTTQTFFFLMSAIFRLNTWPYHSVALVVHLLNSFLFYIVVKKIWKNQYVALIATCLYATSAAHFLSLFYISSFQELGKTFFMLSSLWFWQNYLDTHKKHSMVFSLVCFVLALLSKETAIVLPLLLMIVPLISWGKEGLKVLSAQKLPLLVYFAVAICYLATRLVGFRAIFGVGSYQITFVLSEIVQNLKWYILWIFGLPEQFSDFPNLAPVTIKGFNDHFPLTYPTIGIYICTVGAFGIVGLVRKLQISSQTFWCIIFFIMALLPVLFLHGHRYPQYLDIPLVAIAPLLASFIVRPGKLGQAFGILALGVYIVGQFFTLRLSEQAHWTTHRSQVATYYQQQLAEKLIGRNNMTIAFVGDQKAQTALATALGTSAAPKVWFPNQQLRVIYALPPSAIDHDPDVLIIPISYY